MYKIAKENLTALFQKIAAEQELYLPVKTAGQVNFGVWTEDAEVDLDTLKSVKSPKDLFPAERDSLYLHQGREEDQDRAGGVKGAEFCCVRHESL